MRRGRPQSDINPGLHPARRALAQAVRDQREESGMTVRQVADKAHCSPAAVAHAESGRRIPGPRLFGSMMKAMGQAATSPKVARIYGAAVAAATVVDATCG